MHPGALPVQAAPGCSSPMLYASAPDGVCPPLAVTTLHAPESALHTTAMDAPVLTAAAVCELTCGGCSDVWPEVARRELIMRACHSGAIAGRGACGPWRMQGHSCWSEATAGRADDCLT
eukprot:jgi/Ulvmu1/3975/UM182_0003.1